MNQTKDTQETKNQNRTTRWLTAAGEKLLNWLCQHEMGLSPIESQAFLFHCGLGMEEAALYQSIAQIKRNDA